MPRARRTRRFWVIRWEGDQLQKDFFHVLPATRTPRPILDYMIGLYYNSPSLLISERMNRVHSTLRRNVKSQDLGTRIIVGDNPFLVAYEVENQNTAPADMPQEPLRQVQRDRLEGRLVDDAATSPIIQRDHSLLAK